MITWIGHYVTAAIVFTIIDFIWLSRVGKKLYDDQLGHLLAENPNKGAAVLFYLIFIAGLVFFVINPAVAQESWLYALGAGAFFGLVTYATFDLTNLAVLRNFPASIVPIDMAWGTFLAASVSVVTYWVSRLLNLG